MLYTHQSISYGAPGLLPEKWTAKWIWKSRDIKTNDFAYFRKDIPVKEAIKKAIVFVSAHNHYQLFVNNQRVGGHCSPVHSNPEKSKYFLTYDITGCLQRGMNALCAVAHYIGGEGQNYVNGLPGFILQCEITDMNGLTTTHVTDESWKTLHQTPYRNQAPYQQNRRISAIEDYDANLEQTGWKNNGFDDSSWCNAVLSGINGISWVMKPQTIPEGIVEEIIVPSPCSIQKKGLQVFDTGKIVSGWPKFEIEGCGGDVLVMRYAEELDQNGRVKHIVGGEPSENYYDRYTVKGDALQHWEPDFSYKAFRYVEVTGCSRKLQPHELKIVSAHTGLPCEGYFKSSSQMLNNLYDACIQTLKNNALGQLVDCPHREQAQYLADCDMQAFSLAYQFQAKNMLEKVLTDFSDSQLEDGTFPFVYPSNYPGPDFRLKIPEWDLHYVTLLWKVYFQYKHKESLQTYYDTAAIMLGYYLDIRDKNLCLIPKSEHWHISDWPYYENGEVSYNITDHISDLSPLFNYDIDQSGPYLTVQNIKFYHCLRLMADMAGILNREADAGYYTSQADSMKESILAHLYNKDSKVFVDSYGSKSHRQGTNVLAFQYGLVPDEDREALLNTIEDGGMGCRMLLTLNLLQVLFENGREKTAYEMMINENEPGWGYMLRHFTGTVWEGFVDRDSHSHAWSAYPSRLLMEYMVGIKPQSPGFEVFQIKPFIPLDLTWAEAIVPTIYGPITAGFETKDGTITIKATVPEGTQAIIYLSAGRKLVMVSESGNIIWSHGEETHSSRILDISLDENCKSIKVASGDYILNLSEA